MFVALLGPGTSERSEGGDMRFAISSKWWVASILVIGLFSVALTFVCSEGIHLPFSGTMDTKCAIMGHSDGAAAIAESESASTLVPQLLVVAAGFVAFIFLFEAPARLVPASASSSSPPPDPRFGRFRV